MNDVDAVMTSLTLVLGVLQFEAEGNEAFFVVAAAAEVDDDVRGRRGDFLIVSTASPWRTHLVDPYTCDLVQQSVLPK